MAADLDIRAAWWPEPVPTSRARSAGWGRASWVIGATMYGWEIV
jgi:hypothetical protein